MTHVTKPSVIIYKKEISSYIYTTFYIRFTWLYGPYGKTLILRYNRQRDSSLVLANAISNFWYDWYNFKVSPDETKFIMSKTWINLNCALHCHLTANRFTQSNLSSSTSEIQIKIAIFFCFSTICLKFCCIGTLFASRATRWKEVRIRKYLFKRLLFVLIF